MKDKKILYQLDVNSRQPNSEIAKKVGLSKQVVGFRVKRLVDEEVINVFYSVIDISKLGFTVHKNFLRLKNLDSRKEKGLLDFLKNHPDIVWVASCDGKYDLAFGTWARDMAFLDKTITELNKKFGEYISEREIATIIRGEYFTRDYFITNKENKENKEHRESFFESVPAPIKIDEHDWNILVQIASNSRKTCVDLAREIKLSPDAIADRIKRLEKSGVLKHYNIVLNESKYSYLHYKILIGFRNISEQKEKLFRDYCKANPNVVYIVKALGSWDTEIDIEVETPEKLREIIMEVKTKFSEIIRDYSTLHIYQVHKYNFCPSIKT